MSLAQILSKIQTIKTESGHRDVPVKLIAVSKVQPIERVRKVLEDGYRIFGENKVQEAAGKWPALIEEFGPTELHLLGPLQSNKTRQAMELFDVIHSVDRLKIAKTIARIAVEIGKCPQLFIQVNTGDEPQKAGIAPDQLDAFIAECRVLELPIIGLMCIPPASEEPTFHFKMLAEMAKRNNLPELSMGMSGDFEEAVACGATHVRVGSAIFGDRDYS